MRIEDFLTPGTLIVSILLGTWMNWGVLSIYGRDSRKVYVKKLGALLLCLILYTYLAPLQNIVNLGGLFFFFVMGLVAAFLYISIMRRAEDIIHFSLAQKIILFIIVPIFGSYIEIINVITYLAVPALMIWPGRKDEVTHVDRQS